MAAISHDPNDYPAQVCLMVAGIARLKYGGDEQAAWKAYWHDLETQAPLLVKSHPNAKLKTACRARKKSG